MKKAARPVQQGLTYEGGRPREEDILTRRKTGFWDRIKWLLLLTVIWLLLVLSMMGDDPLIGFVDAARIQVHMGYWVFILMGLELIHQLHFFISEHWAAYNQFWVKKIWGNWAAFGNRHFSPWTKFRITRIFSWAVMITAVAILTGKIIHEPPALALSRIPAIIWHSIPFILQIVFTLLLVVGQFAAIF